MNGCSCKVSLFVDNVAVSMHVTLLALIALIVTVNGTIEFASELVAVVLLGGDAFDIAVVADGVNVLNAVDTAFTAVIFVFVLNTFSCHFFLWLYLPCPGPGMLSVETEGDKEKLEDWCWVLYNW